MRYALADGMEDGDITVCFLAFGGELVVGFVGAQTDDAYSIGFPSIRDLSNYERQVNEARNGTQTVVVMRSQTYRSA